MVSIDIYVNETTRHAHLILPPASSLQHDHYDTVFNAFAVRNVTRYNEALWERAAEERYDWEIINGLGTALAARSGREFSGMPPPSAMFGGILQKVGGRHGVSLESLRAAPHGIDLGALRPSLYGRLETADKLVHCAPEPVLADLARFNRELLEGAAANGSLQLIGRRHVRSNNSWMHQYHRLTKGKPRHQLLMHPDDLAARGLTTGQTVEVRSSVGAVRIPVESSTDVMRGVVCLPHGWGHDRPGARLNGASRNPGVSYNDLSDDKRLDAVSGNAALNGLTVEVSAAGAS
jgi:anaerobic selenocysteine-containing dehydrogenase